MSVRELRNKLSEAIDAAASGDDVVVTRRGRPVARIIGAGRRPGRLPSFAKLRSSIRWKGASAVDELGRMRDDGRFDPRGR